MVTDGMREGDTVKEGFERHGRLRWFDPSRDNAHARYIRTAKALSLSSKKIANAGVESSRDSVQ